MYARIEVYDEHGQFEGYAFALSPRHLELMQENLLARNNARTLVCTHSAFAPLLRESTDNAGTVIQLALYRAYQHLMRKPWRPRNGLGGES